MKKTIKKISTLVLGVLAMMGMASCTKVEVNAGEEAVKIHQPWIFGHGGVDEKPVKTGLEWTWLSTSSEKFRITPVKYEQELNDIISNENTPLDFKTMILLKITEGKTPVLLQNYGKDWYENNIKNYHYNLTCNYVSRYSPFELTSNREVLAKIDSCVKADMVKYIGELSVNKEFPVEVIDVITGRAIPNSAQLEEMNNTAAQIQAKQTQNRREEMEEARERAEKKRAAADKAYQHEMGLSADQFIQLRAWDVIEKKQGANIDVLVGGGTSQMWNIRR